MNNDLLQFEPCGTVLEPHQPAVKSYSQLSRRTRLPEDRVRRMLDRLEEFAYGPVVRTERGRFVLTAKGCKLLDISRKLYRLQQADHGEDEVEPLTVEIDPELIGVVGDTVLQQFDATFGGTVTPKYVPFTPDVYDNIAAGHTAFGLGFVTSIGGGEPIGRPVPWVLTKHAARPAAESAGPGLSEADRLFFVGGLDPAAVAPLLQVVCPANRVACASLAQVRGFVAAGLGLGLDLALPGQASGPAGVHATPLPHLPAVQVAVFLPRNHAHLSEPARCLLDAIRVALAGPADTNDESPAACSPDSRRNATSTLDPHPVPTGEE